MYQIDCNNIDNIELLIVVSLENLRVLNLSISGIIKRKTISAS
jgi:hypothetical protein